MNKATCTGQQHAPKRNRLRSTSPKRTLAPIYQSPLLNLYLMTTPNLVKPYSSTKNTKQKETRPNYHLFQIIRCLIIAQVSHNTVTHNLANIPMCQSLRALLVRKRFYAQFFGYRTPKIKCKIGAQLGPIFPIPKSG